MNCPKCESKNTERVHLFDPLWRCGDQICKDCGFREHWLFFMEDKNCRKYAGIEM